MKQLIFGFFLIFLFYSAHCNKKQRRDLAIKNNIRQLQDQIEVIQQLNPRKGRSLMLGTLLNNTLKKIRAKEIPDDSVKPLMLALIRTDKDFCKRKNIFIKSYDTFYTTNGYMHTLRMILANPYNANMVKGHTFELELALQLQKAGERVTAFNKIVSEGNKIREFDVVTERCAYECKNLNKWRKRKKLKQQFTAQSVLVNKLTAPHGERLNYVVVSKHGFPPGMIAWFQMNDIPFAESKASHN